MLVNEQLNNLYIITFGSINMFWIELNLCGKILLLYNLLVVVAKVNNFISVISAMIVYCLIIFQSTDLLKKMKV